MKTRICAVLFVCLLVLASQPSASGGQRKGFIIGGGLGIGYLAGSPFHLDRAYSPAANFKIGYAPSDTVEISLTNAASGIYAIYDDADYFFGVNAVALTLYKKPKGPGLFVTGGIGTAYKILLESGYHSTKNGIGFIGGVGYEMGRHWSVQADVVSMNAGDEHYTAIRLTLNILAY